MKVSIGIVGFGTMGSAIFERAADAFDFIVYEKDCAKTAALAAGICEEELERLAARSEAVVLAVKPQDFSALLAGFRSSLNKTVISIAAGIATPTIEQALPGARVVRVMPNLAVKVGKAMSCIARGKSASGKDLELAERLFKKLGQVLVINETMMNAATAVSGSGPGFLYELLQDKSLHEAENFARHMFAPELQEAAVEVGFNGDQARLLAKATVEGAMELLRVSGISAVELRDKVTSKGGTTAAGLQALRNGGSLGEAVKAALARAQELAKT